MTDFSKLAPRELLATAIIDRDKAVLRHRNAASTAENAKSLMTSAQVNVLSFSGLDDQITSFRSQRVAEWTAAGGGATGVITGLSLDLPDGMAAEFEARDLAAADAASAKAVHQRLAADAHAAAVARQQAENVVSVCANMVLVETAESVADELGKAQALVDALRYRLRAFASVQPPLPMSKRARELAEFPREPYLIPGRNPQTHEFENVQAFHTRLRFDPESPIDLVLIDR